MVQIDQSGNTKKVQGCRRQKNVNTITHHNGTNWDNNAWYNNAQVENNYNYTFTHPHSNPLTLI